MRPGQRRTFDFVVTLSLLVVAFIIYYYVSFMPRPGSFVGDFGAALSTLESRIKVESALQSDGKTTVYKVIGNDPNIMSTSASLVFWTTSPQEVDKLKISLRWAYLEFYKIVGLCNIFDPNTEASRLNATAAQAPFKCSDELWELIDIARQSYKLTGGAFDITTKPLMELWGFYRKRGELPTAAEREAALKLVGLDKVQFNDADKTVFFPVKGMSFDFGGIAKGYAIEKATAAARQTGAKNGLINLGGNIYGFGKGAPERDSYNIGLRDPRDKDAIIKVVELRDQAVASSGDYERFVVIDGQTYTHIMNPKTGEPVANMAQTTVVTPSATWSDVLSTAVFVGGRGLAGKLVNEVPDTWMYLCEIVGDEIIAYDIKPSAEADLPAPAAKKAQ